MQPAILTASIRKQVASLRQSRHRRDEGLFVIEGTRAVLDSVECFEVVYLIATSRWLGENSALLPQGLPTPLVAKNDEMERISSMSTPQGVLAVCRMPQQAEAPDKLAYGELILALDKVQDPGNMGTIIRIADWMGVTTILASHDTVDIYNPKVVQSTMGALARVNVIYVDLEETLGRFGRDVEIYGTFLDGDDIYGSRLTVGGVVVMGNEGNGISDDVGRLVSKRLRIPSYPRGRQTVESLNVSVATAITLAEFRRRANANQP